MTGQRLTRDLKDSMLGGVCSGFASRYGFDVTLVRVVMVLLTVATGGIGVPIYIAAWIVMPREDSPAPAPRPASDTPDSLSRELREVSDRLAEAARVLADKTREAAEEISEIARRARTTDGAATGATTATPEATMSETPDMANGRESDVDESLSTSMPHTGSATRTLSDQSPNPPPTPPAGPVPPVPPAP